MVLIEWDTPDKLKQLREILQRDGRGIPNNLIVDTSITYSIEQRYPVSRLRYFSTEIVGIQLPDTSLFSRRTVKPSVSTRAPPPSGHDDVILRAALADLIEKFKDRIERDGAVNMMTDQRTKDVFLSLLPTSLPFFVDLSPASTIVVFYMTDEQKGMLQEMDLPSIAGFYADGVDLEKDAKKIHENWIHSPSLESTTARLRHLPASVVRDSTTGEAVSWDMSSPFGQCSNLFTIPAYRGRGLAVLAQLHLAKTFISQGLRPFKYIEISNSRLLNATARHPLWMRWEEEND
ncbi:hypothetical protein PMAYCL1PPCAC_33397, partial [Pristionchus mayeri]